MHLGNRAIVCCACIDCIALYYAVMPCDTCVTESESERESEAFQLVVMVENDLHTLAEGSLACPPSARCVLCVGSEGIDHAPELYLPPIFGPMGREQPGRVWGCGMGGSGTQHTDGVEASVEWRSG